MTEWFCNRLPCDKESTVFSGSHVMMGNSTAADLLEISQQTQDNINFCTSIEAKINETSFVLYH